MSNELFSSVMKTISVKPNNLLDLLQKYNVIIPALQRHYVQGADSAQAKEIRRQFVSTILNNAAKPDKTMHLDFIYGQIETDGLDAFVPLDGQQRLTTIWLVTHYAVSRLKNKTNRNPLLQLLSRFSYQGRTHAERFGAELTNPENFKDSVSKESILKSNWFNPYWLNDSTVSAMLNTLETIDELWGESVAETVISFIATKCTFELCHENFASDIYMKMNARGLSLTQWENFKGKFEALIKPKQGNVSEQIQKCSDLYFEKTGNLPDNAFFAYMARLFVYLAGDRIYSDDKKTVRADFSNIVNLSKFTNFGNPLPFVPFNEFEKCFEFISEEDQKALVNVFERIVSVAKEKDFATPYWQSDRKLVDAAFSPKNPKELIFSLILFDYFKKHSAPEYEAFKKALRYIWNILENTNSGKICDYMKQVITANGATLYSEKIDFDKSTSIPDQFLEENLKYQFYTGDKQCGLSELQLAEKHMHGRVRIAIRKEWEKEWELHSDSIIRLKVLNVLFEEYGKNKKNVLKNIINVMPYVLKSEIIINFSNDNLREILSTNNDQELDKNRLFGDSTSPNKLNDKKSYEIDWRQSVCHLIEQNKKGIIHRHHSGVIYYYRVSRINGAIPINDYRFELFENKEIKAYLEKTYDQSDTSGRLNDSTTISMGIRDNKNARFYLYNHGFDLKLWRDKKHIGSLWQGYSEIQGNGFLEKLNEFNSMIDPWITEKMNEQK